MEACIKDNDPKHRVKSVKKRFSVNKIDVVPRLAQFPDFNPIENLWHDFGTENRSL